MKYLNRSLWRPDLDNISMVIHQVFVEIPLGNHTRVLRQIFPNWTGVSSVNINLLEDLELCSVLMEDNISYLLCLARFLTTELITGKS